MSDDDRVTPSPWRQWRVATPARLALGRAGAGMPTDETLRFGWAHAMARDAVHDPLDGAALAAALQAQGFGTLAARSMAPDRESYLLRPDLGRRIHPDSRAMLEQAPRADIALVIADGLSAQAAERHALPVAMLLSGGLYWLLLTVAHSLGY